MWYDYFIEISTIQLRYKIISRLGIKGHPIDPRVRHIFSRRFGPENISTTILLLRLNQEEHLSVNGERMGAKYW